MFGGTELECSIPPRPASVLELRGPTVSHACPSSVNIILPAELVHNSLQAAALKRRTGRTCRRVSIYVAPCGLQELSYQSPADTTGGLSDACCEFQIRCLLRVSDSRSLEWSATSHCNAVTLRDFKLPHPVSTACRPVAQHTGMRRNRRQHAVMQDECRLIPPGKQQAAASRLKPRWWTAM